MQTDVIIIGGGIAGLWTLARLRKQGYSAYLIEAKAIGGIQSIASQGIIHGGTKYALAGKLGDSAKAIGDMPAVWNDCLAGQGEVDLSRVKVNSRKQLMWSTQTTVSRVAGFFAGQLMKDRMQQLDRDQFPVPFKDPAFKGVLYELNEPVLDTASLMSVLFEQFADYCLAGNIEFFDSNPLNFRCQQAESDDDVEIETRQLVLAAGAGNAAILAQLQRDKPAMQKRPVHMVMVKGELPEIYAHCLGASANPRVTITSAKMGDETVWYIGGQIAENGIALDRDEQIQACRKELAEILHWVDLTETQWSTLLIDRAEIQTPGNKRPDSSFVEADRGVITVWPTKLAFAPKAAARVSKLLARSGILPGKSTDTQSGWSRPVLARWPWEETRWS